MTAHFHGCAPRDPHKFSDYMERQCLQNLQNSEEAFSQPGWSTSLGGCGCLWHRLNYAHLFEGTRETLC